MTAGLVRGAHNLRRARWVIVQADLTMGGKADGGGKRSRSDEKKNGVSVDYQLSICIACTGVFTHILTLMGLPTDITYGATAECCVK